MRRLARGFTLVETLVAITVLLIAILAPMRIVSQSIKAATFSREQLTAVFLAQEALEAVQRDRDNSAIASPDDTWGWFGALPSACTDGDTGCDYDAVNETFVPCNGDACRLYFDEDAGDGFFYSHDDSGGITSPFTRTLFLSEDNQTGEAEVTAVVSWYSSIVDDTVNVTIRTELFDQYE
jgi:prepilin-type N-terminal cleavage/methylation domain-containing protein